jgi:hypothetical protein
VIVGNASRDIPFFAVLLKATDPGFRHSAFTRVFDPLWTRVNALFPPGLLANPPCALSVFSEALKIRRRNQPGAWSLGKAQ